MGTASGLLACAVSSVFFGSCFVPVKRHEAGNGIFVQWIMSVGILFVGLCVYALEDFPTFYPLAMLGGVLWSIGNATAIPIMGELGIGLGMLVWGLTNVLTGWACGTFGLFGTKAHPPTSVLLNAIGLVCVIGGGVLFSRVKPTPRPSSSSTESLTSRSTPPFFDEEERLMAGRLEGEDSLLGEGEDRHLLSRTDDHNRNRRRFVAFGTALVAGFFYGSTFVPVIYMQENPDKFPGAPSAGLPYVFSHFCGIFLMSTIMFIVYDVFTLNKPFVNPVIVGPSIATGVMWGVAQSSWFVANEELSQAITFPIIGMLPGALSALWSVLYFKDIRGARNIRILSIAILVTTIGAVFVALSK